MAFDTISRDLMISSLKNYLKDNISQDFLRTCDAQNVCPEDFVRKLNKDLGITKFLSSVEGGGLGANTSDVYLLCEELGRTDLGIATVIFATFLGTDPINVGGTQEQKKYWFNQIISKNMLVAYCATEADAGSDLVALKTTATPVLEQDKIVGYKINGSKNWISNGGIADLYTVLAITGKGVSWFLVPKGTQGLIPQKEEDKHGIRLSNTTAISFEDVYVPAENLIGLIVGQGLQQAQSVFGYTRLMVGALALGAGSSALEIAVDYASHRKQAGSVLAEKQGYTQKLLTPNAINLEASRSYINAIAEKLDLAPHTHSTEGAIAKYFSSESANKTAENAIQALGGFGYSKDFSVEKLKRDIKITCIYEGTNEIMEMTVYRARWQDHLKTRGNFYKERANNLENLESVGAKSLAKAFNFLAETLEFCRSQHLTRHQAVNFKLGSIIAEAEVAETFITETLLNKKAQSSRFTLDTLRLMAEIKAKEASFNILTRCTKMVAETCNQENAKQFLEKVPFVEIMQNLSNISDDKDKITHKLVEVFAK